MQLIHQTFNLKDSNCLKCAVNSHPDALLREERGDIVARLPGRDVGNLEALGRHEDVLVVALLALVVSEVQARLVDEASVVCRLQGRVHN